MSGTSDEYAAVTPLTSAIFTRYTIIADGSIIFESAEWGAAYHFFLDHRYDAGVKDISFVIKKRTMPVGGRYNDIAW
jgi:hypothetical protein